MSKHVPMRTCVICRAKKPKALLLRHTCPDDSDRHLKPDPKGSRQGRGFYTCLDKSCWEKIDRFRGWIHKCKGVVSNVR
ncbi:MAG: YlxR family protein [Desulfonatronovibrio sp.]